ncbi:PAS domain S-box protein [Saccharicrinis sp. 156]|uniref:PAS domain S-box protein n=1 Tax=Saccharicrinis sp. 156 TaxID=3417574 RepID=UPI003D324D22
MDHLKKIKEKLIKEFQKLHGENRVLKTKYAKKSLAQKRESHELKGEQQKAILHSIPSGFWRADMQGRLLEVNAAYCQMSGYSEQELLKMCISDLDAIENAEATLARLQKMKEFGGEHFESKHTRKDGSIFDVEVITNYLNINDGQIVGFTNNITERKKAIKKLEESESRYKSVFTNAGLGIATVSIDSKLLTANPEFENILGYTLEELKGLTFSEFTHPDDIKKDEEQYRKLMHSKIDSYKMDKRYIHKKGHVIWGQLTVSVVKDEYNNILYSVALVKDITAKKNTETQLLLSTARLKEAQKIALLGNFEHDFKQGTSWWSEQAYTIFGFEPNPNPPQFNFIIQRLPEADAVKFTALLQRAEKNGEDYSLTFRYNMPYKKDHKYIWLQAAVLFDDQKKPQGVKGIIQDVTQKRKLEIEKDLYLERISSLMKYTDEGFYLFETSEPVDVSLPAQEQVKLIYSGVIVECNDAQAKMYGYTKATDIHGKTLLELHGEDSNPENISFILDWIESNYEIRNAVSEERDINGNAIYFSNNIIGIINEGKLERIWGTQRDITDHIKYEQSLKDAKQKAEVANIYKNQFLANMSHEIRTPMNGMVGFADLLDSDDIDKETRSSYVQIIKNSSDQLLNLINDIIDVSKIEAGELKLKITSCSLKNIFANIDASTKIQKREKGKGHLEIKYVKPKEFDDLMIETDPLRLQQILINLINNALKFTHKGRIEYGFKLNDKTIIFFVKDTGIGMNKEEVNLIFNRFEQLETNDPGKNEGTGLGLSISKGIVDLLGGEFVVESEPGVGSDFTFTIPLKMTQENYTLNSSN